jgi:hypothetical protein
MKTDPAFSIYALADSDRHVAVSPENSRVIRHCLGLWKDLGAVPADRTVRGVFVKRDAEGRWTSVDETQQENDITIRQLRPLTG